jgi:iron complex outermembrane recepter protein
MIKFSSELRASVALVGLFSAIASPAVAQTASSTTQATEAVEGAETDAIVVVGSRIRRDTFDSASPVQVITREETTLAGFDSTTEALQGTAVTGGTAQINNAFGGFVTNGGPGANTLSLRGLGAERSLILLNGRRIAPSGTRGAVGSADLNVLPSAIVERFEILKDGASSIYGSDAVAGVVNIITRKKLNEITLEGSYNPTWDGGGDSGSVAIVFGQTGDRFNIAGSVEYLKRNSLALGDRDWTQCNTDLRRTATNRTLGSGDFIDPLTGAAKCYPITSTGSNGVTINTIGTNTTAGVGAAGSVGTSFNRWRPNSAVTTGLVGFEGVGGGANSLGVRDTFDKRTLNRSLISPGKILTGYVQGGYDLQALGGAEIYAEFLWTRRTSSQVGFRQLSLDYNKGSALIPTNLQASTFSGPQITSGGRNVGVRAFIGFGNDTSSQSLTFYKAGAGIKGDFFFPGWNYDLYVGHSASNASYTFQSFLTDRLTQSLNVVAVPGGFACVDTSRGCVAAPALTTQTIAGNLPKAWVDFVFKDVTGVTKYNETVVNFGLDGNLFELPYGKVGAAIGLEYRADKIDDTPAADSQVGNLYNLTSSAVTRGTDSVWEVYGELEVPVLRNLPFAEDLTINGSARYTNYRSYGGDSTYKIGGIYSPFKFLSFRGTYGTSYRAPALFEQFLGATSGFLSSTLDPCNNFDAPGVSPIRVANCRSEGLPAGFSSTSGITVLSSGGAAAGLKAETSRNLTLGLVLQPKFGKAVGDLQFAVDYYNIQVKNGVSRAGAGNILQLCYDDPQFRAGGGFCRLINPRNPSSNALTVNDSYVNLATDRVRGIDYTLRYSRDIGEARLRLYAQVTQYLEQSNKLFETDPLDDLNGTLNTPDFTGTFEATLTYKKFQFRYGFDWIAAMQSYDYFGLDRATTPFYLEVPDYFTHNASVRYRTEKFTVTAGIRNFTDKKPPVISSGVYSRVGNAPLYSGYDYVGRSMFVTVSKTF